MTTKEPFYWGAATSAHQVEGNTKNDWSEWERSAGRVSELKSRGEDVDSHISGVACDHFNRYEEDFDIAKELGHNAHRFSLEWSRIEPEKGKFDRAAIEHYRAVVAALRARGIEPFVTLWHWTLPLWLRDEGGAASPKFPEYFSRYVHHVSVALAKDVSHWITLNEPEIYSFNAYLRGKWPPQKKSILAYFKVMHNLVQAHRRAAVELSKCEGANIGVSVNCPYFESGGGVLNGIMTAAAKKFWNYWFLDRVRYSIDFIGLNYYFHNRIRYGFNKNINEAVTDMGWEVFPEGIACVLKELYSRYKRPIVITENGLADAKDERRAKFITDHVAAMRKAAHEGVDVRGYLHWSLLDNFEWSDGFRPRFGLVEVDFKTQKRTIRPSARAYRDIIRGGKGKH